MLERIERLEGVEAARSGGASSGVAGLRTHSARCHWPERPARPDGSQSPPLSAERRHAARVLAEGGEAAELAC